jgi:sodium/potassium-transporting ATPase subunit alpha
MRKSNVLCKSLSTVESLGSVNVIASDKTGTLTENVMTAVNLAFGAENRYSVEEALELLHQDAHGNQCVKALAAIAGLCNDAEFEAKDGAGSSGPRKINGDATGMFHLHMTLSEIPWLSLHSTDVGLLRFSDNISPVANARLEWKEVGKVAFNSSERILCTLSSLSLCSHISWE